jgi:hypothetical protein
MTFVYFAHSPDQKLLEQSARAVRRLYGDPKIVVFWEEGKEGYLEGAENLTSSFERGGNLNGIDCCRGIIDCMLLVNEPKVVKIDCDVILVKKIEDHKGFWFMEAVEGFCGIGSCYSISREILLLCKEKLVGYVALPRARYPEDFSLSILCQIVGEGTLKFWNNGEHVVGYAYDKQWDFYAAKQVIHMGNPEASIDIRIKKAVDSFHMKLFNDYLDEKSVGV